MAGAWPLVCILLVASPVAADELFKALMEQRWADANEHVKTRAKDSVTPIDVLANAVSYVLEANPSKEVVVQAVENFQSFGGEHHKDAKQKYLKTWMLNAVRGGQLDPFEAALAKVELSDLEAERVLEMALVHAVENPGRDMWLIGGGRMPRPRFTQVLESVLSGGRGDVDKLIPNSVKDFEKNVDFLAKDVISSARTALVHAATVGRAPLFELLLDYNAGLKTVQGDGRTAWEHIKVLPHDWLIPVCIAYAKERIAQNDYSFAPPDLEEMAAKPDKKRRRVEKR